MATVHKEFKQDKYTVTYEVQAEEDGLRLDRFLQQLMPAFSRQALQKKIELGEVVCPTRALIPGRKVRQGERISVTSKRDQQETETWGPESLPLAKPQIIFEDQNLLAINKPPYMATHPAGKHLFNCATVYFSDLLQQTIYSIHRLDRETSGLLLLGKNAATAAQVSGYFEQGLVRKCYFFIAHRLPNAPTTKYFTATERLQMGGREEDYMGKTRRQIRVTILPADASEGKTACTDFVLLDLPKHPHLPGPLPYVLGLAFPRTGRQHQIRAHAAAHHLPLVGDKIYHLGRAVFERFKDGNDTAEDRALMELPRHALHALALQIPYPDPGHPQLWQAPLPDDLTAWIQQKLHFGPAILKEAITQEIKTHFARPKDAIPPR
ncbi:MAG: RluA family pseudouridine synthase [Bacteriovoracaceae bacterium]|nr:RluA family pseudouridine synthase [Bacteriovoracaceae bacterium]